MTWIISIAAAVTVAVTAILIRLIFLSGKTITNASLFGRFVAQTEMARQAFAEGWRKRSWRYLFICYPSILVSMGLVSVFLYWMMPALGNRDSYGDMIRYSLLVFGVGVSASLFLTFVLIFLVYFIICLFKNWWNPAANQASLDASADATKPPAPLPDR